MGEEDTGRMSLAPFLVGREKNRHVSLWRLLLWEPRKGSYVWSLFAGKTTEEDAREGSGRLPDVIRKKADDKIWSGGGRFARKPRLLSNAA